MRNMDFDFENDMNNTCIEDMAQYVASHADFFEKLCIPGECNLVEDPRCEQHLVHDALRQGCSIAYDNEVRPGYTLVRIRDGFYGDGHHLIYLANYIDMYTCTWQTRVQVMAGYFDVVQVINAQRHQTPVPDEVRYEEDMWLPGEFPALHVTRAAQNAAFATLHLFDVNHVRYADDASLRNLFALQVQVT